MGNCTATIKKRTGVSAVGQAVIADLALSTSYATGGDAIPPSIFGLSGISMLHIGSPGTTPGGHALEFIYGTEAAGPLVRVRDVATGAELANASNNAAQSVRVTAILDPFV